MSTAVLLYRRTRSAISGWSWFKKTLMAIVTIGFLISNWLFLTPWGTNIREELAGMVIMTRHRDWAWLAVGAARRDDMVNRMWQVAEENSQEKQQIDRVVITAPPVRKDRTRNELIKVVDIQDKNHATPIWKGKMMYVYDPTSIRVVTTSHFQEGEKISDMVKRTGAVAGVNGGAFEDPEGLGNGFAPIGFIKSAGQLLYNAEDGIVPQHTVGFTNKGVLVIGKYRLDELEAMHVTDAVFWYPRIIANGNALPVDDVSGRNPRTVVGQRRDGTVIFVIIDGRSTTSIGATVKEVQDLMVEQECDNAGFLDGGASSELVVDGNVLTKPASKYGERRLPSGFLVFDHPEDYVPVRIWDNVKKIDPGGSYDHPDFLKEQADLRARGLLNPTPAPTPKSTPTPTPKEVPSPVPSSSASSSATPDASTGVGTGSSPGASASPGSPSTSPGVGGLTPSPSAGAPSPGATPGSTGGAGAAPSPTVAASAAPQQGGATPPPVTPAPATASAAPATPSPVVQLQQ